MILLNQSTSRRRLPVNLRDGDLYLFAKELEKQIPATQLLDFKNVRVNDDGLIFRGVSILPESFVNARLPRYRSIKHHLQFLTNNYLRRKTIEFSNDCIWFINNWAYNYFHWMTEAVPRLFAASHFLDKATVLLPGRYERTEYVQSSLRPFGALDLRFVPEHQVFLVRNLLLPTETAMTGNYNDALIREMRSFYTKYQRSRCRPSLPYDKIYVSRGKARRRKLMNEDGVISLLRDYGFETIYLEDLKFEDQVLVSMNAKYLVSNHGAGLTNMLFMNAGSSVLELRKERDARSNCFFSLASAVDLNYFYLTCRSYDETEDAHTADLIVDFKKLRETVELMLLHEDDHSPRPVSTQSGSKVEAYTRGMARVPNDNFNG